MTKKQKYVFMGSCILSLFSFTLLDGVESMIKEQKILTDLEMTNFIWNHTKGDGHRKLAVKEDWLSFSEYSYVEAEYKTPSDFIDRINDWFHDHKIPIKVISFNLFDEDIGGTDWIVEEVEL